METKVLLIEDEADLCMILKKLLEREHFVVECAHTIADGIERIKMFEPAIVFLDHTLPDGSGVNIIPVLKQLCPRARLVMISAMEQVMKEALEQGADRFIKKPFRFENVLDFVVSESKNRL